MKNVALEGFNLSVWQWEWVGKFVFFFFFFLFPQTLLKEEVNIVRSGTNTFQVYLWVDESFMFVIIRVNP